MIRDGFLDEVRGLLNQGYSPSLPSLSAIGYPQLAAVIDGTATLEDAVLSIRKATRTYVRRQANWFKLTDPAIHWLHLSEGSAAHV